MLWSVYASASALAACIAACAVLGLKLSIHFVVDFRNAAVCIDVLAAGARIAKIRLFALGDGVYFKLNSKQTQKVRKSGKKPRPRQALAIAKAARLRADSLTVRITLPVGEYPYTAYVQIAANAALACLSHFLICDSHDCEMRVTATPSAAFYGSLTFSAASALECALACVKASKAQKKSGLRRSSDTL